MDHAAISRALEERTKELDGLRRQLAREESEKHELFAQINSLVGEMAQLKQADEDLGSPRALELEQLKTDFGKKQAELQRSNQHLAEMREEVQRRERMAELERRRMEEELRERDELLKELTETGDELGRALNEANNDLQAAREQLVAVQQELAVTRHRPAGEGAFTSENSSATLLQLEHFQRELTDLGAQLELAEQKIGRTEMEAAESEEMLRQKNVQLERAHAEMAAEKQITSQLTHRVAELEQRLAQVDVLCAEVSEELNRAEAALEEERGRHAAELQLIRQEQMDRAEQAKAAAGEEADEKVAKLEAECAQLLAEKHRSQTQLRTEQAAHELELQRAREQAQEEIEKSATEAARHNEENANEKLAQLEAENAKLATDLQMAQKSVESTMKAEKTNHQMELARARGELEANRAEANRAFELERRDLKEKLSQLEQENMVLSANLLAEQQRAERESRQQRNELERLQDDLAREREEVERRRKEQEEEEDQQKTPLQSPEPPSTPTAKPRKMLNGGGTAQTSTEEEEQQQQQQREKQNFSEKEELLRLGAELDKQKRLVTVLRKKLQQQQLDALKRDREATTGQSGQQNGR